MSFFLCFFSRVLSAQDIKHWISNLSAPNNKKLCNYIIKMSGRHLFCFRSFLIMEKRITPTDKLQYFSHSGTSYWCWSESTDSWKQARVSHGWLFWPLINVTLICDTLLIKNLRDGVCLCYLSVFFLWFLSLRLCSKNRFGFSPSVARTFFFSL